MTVRDVICEFCDSQLYPDMEQEVRFACGDLVFDGFAGAEIPEKGPAVVKLRPAARPRRFMFSLKFEANPVIEAVSVEEAEKKAYEMMQGVAVTKVDHDGEHFVQDDYVAKEPCFLKEVKI